MQIRKSCLWIKESELLEMPSDALALERRKEVLGDGAIMAVAESARRVLKIVSTCERGSAHAGELRALFRVDLPRCFGLR